MSQIISAQHLDASQKAMAKKITDYGKANGFNNAENQMAIKIAYLESSLGKIAGKNPDSSALGVYQYTIGTWAERHKDLGERGDTDNQIKAFFSDVAKWRERWNDNANGQIPQDKITFEEYIYTKHHDGNNYHKDFVNAPGRQIWNSINFSLA